MVKLVLMEIGDPRENQESKEPPVKQVHKGTTVFKVLKVEREGEDQ
jgi:hypothetical protein